MDSHAIKDYYAQLKDQNIGDIATELMPGRLTHTNHHLLLFNCPNHASHSKKSLQVDTHKQLWNCFGCGVGGDILHLVEFIQSGSPTAHTNGKMPESHRSARDWLAAKKNMLPLSRHGMSPEEIQQAETEQLRNERALACLEAAITYWHHRLFSAPDLEPLHLMRSKYALSDEILRTLKVGYTDNSSYIDTSNHPWPFLFDHLESLGFTTADMNACGVAYQDLKDASLRKLRFINRFSFPYFLKGRPHYLICRQTPWSKDGAAKYKKLPVYDEHQNAKIARIISNDILYNEDILLSKPDHVIITEGVTDCITGMDHGLPCVAPVTTTIKHGDWARILPKLAGIPRIYLCQDNEISQAGITGAIKNARVLINNGADARLIILPPDEPHIVFRQEVAARWAITETLTKQEVQTRKAALPVEEQDEFIRLAEAAKVDMNSYFAAGHTTEEFSALLAQALAPVEFAISRLPRFDESKITDGNDSQGTPANNPTPTPPLTPEDLATRLKPILEEIGEYPILLRRPFIQQVKERTGSLFSVKDLDRQVTDYAKQTNQLHRAALKKSATQIKAPQGSLRYIIESQFAAFAAAEEPPDYKVIVTAMWDWLVAHGATVFRTQNDDVKLAFGGNLYSFSSGGRNDQARIRAFLFDQAGLIQTRTQDRTIIEAFTHQARLIAKKQDESGWLHTDFENHTVYFNLNNDEHELVKITPDGVEIICNGNNSNNIYLSNSPSIKPITYIPDVPSADAVSLIDNLILTPFSCPRPTAQILFLWWSAFLLIEFASTKPVARAQGNSGSGKSFAQRLLSTLLYGTDRLKRSTIAALYSSSQIEPIQFLDNLESAQANNDIIFFMVTTASGLSSDKRDVGTDSGVITECPKTLFFSSGIESFASHLTEMTSRTFVFTFDQEHRSSTSAAGFLEASLLNEVKRYRDQILSYLFQQTSLVLRLMSQGGMANAKALIERTMPDHPKARSNDYLALMYLLLICDEPAEQQQQSFTKMNSTFLQAVFNVNEDSQNESSEASPVATCLSMLFHRHDAVSSLPGELQEFYGKFPVRFETDDETEWHLSRDIHVALSIISRESNISYPVKSPDVLTKRLKSDGLALLDAGFIIEWNQRKARRLYVKIRRGD